MELTGNQVRELNDFMGGDYEQDVTVKHLTRQVICAGTDDEHVREAGLYVWCTDYPEEGCILLSPEPDTPAA